MQVTIPALLVNWWTVGTSIRRIVNDESIASAVQWWSALFGARA